MARKYRGCLRCARSSVGEDSTSTARGGDLDRAFLSRLDLHPRHVEVGAGEGFAEDLPRESVLVFEGLVNPFVLLPQTSSAEEGQEREESSDWLRQRRAPGAREDCASAAGDGLRVEK